MKVGRSVEQRGWLFVLGNPREEAFRCLAQRSAAIARRLAAQRRALPFDESIIIDFFGHSVDKVNYK